MNDLNSILLRGVIVKTPLYVPALSNPTEKVLEIVVESVFYYKDKTTKKLIRTVNTVPVRMELPCKVPFDKLIEGRRVLVIGRLVYQEGTPAHIQAEHMELKAKCKDGIFY